MSSILDRNASKEEDDEEGVQPEITLSTASLLGIFLSLVLICGVFFGLGFSVGRRSAPGPLNDARNSGAPAAVLDQPAPSHTANSSGNGAAVDSPPAAAGSPGDVGAAEDASDSAGSIAATGSAAQQTVAAQPVQATPISLPVVETPAERPQPNAAPALSRPAEGSQSTQGSAAPAAEPMAPAGGSDIVQVAAVGRKEDADALASALHRRGFMVAVRTEPQDMLFHVQLGPFASLAEAKTMRQRLLADGYDAIIEP